MLSTAVGGATAFASGLTTFAAAVAVVLFVFAAGLSMIFSASAYQVAILAATACVVMVDHPLYGLRDGLPFLSIYFAGCAFAMLLSFTVWRIHPFAMARQATTLVYARLSTLARCNARLIVAAEFDAEEWARNATDLRSIVRNAIEAARKSLDRIPRAESEGRQLYSDLLYAITDADGVFEYLLAVSHASEQSSSHRFRCDRGARVLAAMSAVLVRMGTALGDPMVAYPVLLRQRLWRLVGYLKHGAITPLPPNTLSAGTEAVASSGPRSQSWLMAARHVIRESFQKLHRNMNVESGGVRHAIRLAAATTGAFFVVRALRLPHGYWATMATLLVMQPSVGTTWVRGIERAVGSTFGATLAIVIGSFAHTSWKLSVAVFPLMCLTMSLRKINYGLFIIFLTPSFVLITDLASPANEFFLSMTRLGENVLGVLFAVLAIRLLWPKRDANKLEGAMAKAVRANLKYLTLCLQGAEVSQAECELARRDAGLASNVLEQTDKLARFERWNMEDAVSDALEVGKVLRRMAGAASHFHVALPGVIPDHDLMSWILAAAEKAKFDEQGISLPPAPSMLRAEQLSSLELDVAQQLMSLRRLLNGNSLHSSMVSRDPGEVGSEGRGADTP
ncbi:FUSC family protein [Paraburkholderia hospita]|uniref:FUSC family protein n=1 Tax=Paraburkholderia hospita TaxID=169430 RepID=UPI0003E7EBC2|nr:FUSC family protein [Paraburkholderia hospita]EUC12385.1 hypothetical protein PMI06_008768 [Burkholderia sp. BT03]SKC52515.1 Uncharacterized membrane protein YccC [Paraburkholderia hospita]